MDAVDKKILMLLQQNAKQNTKEIAGAIIALNDNSDLLASMGESAAKRAKELFSRSNFESSLATHIVKISRKSVKLFDC